LSFYKYQGFKMNAKKNFDKQSLEYHAEPIPGKIALTTTKPCETQQELSMAYTPGVAKPCLEIKDNPQDVWKYTAKSNQVAVVSDGTAVLGLGNIGPEAGLPVMEGKAVLFKRFADIDAFPICINRVFKENGKTDPKLVIETTERLEPTFGGINLEDIGAPACFEIEQTLKKTMNIPVFHDDQHGTAIISLAAIINALEILDKKIEDCKFVVNGAGAAGIACSEFYITAGAKRENFIMCDSKGVIYKGREGMTPEKERFASDTKARTLAEALVGADVFLGLSVPNAVSKEMVQSMADGPIIFAMANPIPEIYPADAVEAGAAVVGTGRTDFPNQINNVLGFPGIFRGALDVRATDINEEMKLAASKALASLACEKVPADVMKVLKKAYPEDAAKGMFDGDNPMSKSYVIPKPFDPRVVPRVARYVAKAAMDSGVARVKIDSLIAYEQSVAERVKKANGFK
jgi:malate dehydrogenase (oxaloacetate-decarboxylating)(NADP+)